MILRLKELQINRESRFAWDSYRRFVQMYGDVVLGLKPHTKKIRSLEEIIERLKVEKGIKEDTEFTVSDLKILVLRFKEAVLKKTSRDFPTDPGNSYGALSLQFSKAG